MRKHYIVYWSEQKESYITSTPHQWLREYGNNHNLPAKSRTSRIEHFLKEKFKFVELTYDNAVVLCHMDTATPDF